MKAHNYRLIIQYDGTDYCGWQIQDNGVSIQQKLTEALEILLKEKIILIGSGRTDAGVHALGQTANFESDQRIDYYKFLHSLNAILPKDIAVREISKASDKFNARFSAKKRSYVYLFAKTKSPFYYKYSYSCGAELDCARLNDLSATLEGEWDFTSFARTQCETLEKRCFIHTIYWKEKTDFYMFYIEANRFLHGMVRAITGTLLYAFKNNLNDEYLIETLRAKDRTAAAQSVPAKGLFLFKVKY